MKKLTSGWSYRLVVSSLLFLILAGCGVTSQNVDDTGDSAQGDASEVWRASAVPFQLCESDTFVVSELSFTRSGDALEGTLMLTSGQTGLMASGPFTGTLSGDKITGTVTLSGDVNAVLDADLTLTDTLSGTLRAQASVACGVSESGVLELELENVQPDSAKPKRIADVDWRDENIYFAFTDRFNNGDTSNDDGAERPDAFDEADLSNERLWHGGDWAGITQKIEQGYFDDLGFTAIWISPVYFQVPAILMENFSSFAETGPFAGFHGYWAEDFLRTDPHFGTLDELKTLVRTAHENDIKIVQDMIVNHTGYGATMNETRPEWFRTEPICYTDAAPDEQACLLAELPDFIQEEPPVADFLDETVRYWVEEIGIDGIRMDTVKHVPDSYWETFFADGGAGDPARIWTVGEVFSGDVGLIAKYQNDIGIPSLFDFPLHYAINEQLSSPDGNLDGVASVFAQDSAYDDPTRLTTFVDNHDVARFVTVSQNRGVSYDNAKERLDLGLSLIYTSRGHPMVYYGTEIALEGGNDPDNRRDMDFSQLSDSTLDERLAILAQARTDYPALTRGAHEVLAQPSNTGTQVLAYRRTLTGEQPVVAVLNNADEPLDLSTLPAGGVPLLGTFADGAALTEITGRNNPLTLQNGLLVGTIPARTLLALSAEAGQGGGSNPDLANVTDLTALPGDGAVKLSWTPVQDSVAVGYRVLYRTGEGAFQAGQFTSITANEAVVYTLENGTSYEFSVVTVDSQGRESDGTTVSATPDATATAQVTFTVDARSQGAADIEIRRFDTGEQLEYPMTPVEGQRGFYETTLELPLLREISFKFANDAPNARNGGYEDALSGTTNRPLLIDEAELTFEGVYDFIVTPVPDAAIQGTVTSGDTPLSTALVESSENPATYYAFTFADGSYYLPFPSGQSATLTASQPSYTSSTQDATAPAEGVDFSLSPVQVGVTKYVIDSDLADWTAPAATLQSPAEGVFGPDNNFETLLVDYDETYLYLGYSYRAAGNSLLLYMDVTEGGSTSAETFDTLPRLVTFDEGVDLFISQFEGQDAQLWNVVSDTEVTRFTTIYPIATAGSAPAFTTEAAIPWTALGFEGQPEAGTVLNLYAGIYGGDDYGAGDIAPDANSTPAAPENTIASLDESAKATFETPFSVTVGE